MYGTQADLFEHGYYDVFENDVKMYGTQAILELWHLVVMFENDVKMYGTQATFGFLLILFCLRMM